MIKKHEDIMQALRADNYAPIYVLCGEEPYYTDKVFDFIAANALDEMAREFDQQIVYGRDLQGADIAPIIGAARGFAMMGGRKVVIVREAQSIKKWDAFGAYLDNLMPQTVLVICYNGKPDKRQGVWKKAAEHPQVIWQQSDKLRDYEVERWIAIRQQQSANKYRSARSPAIGQCHRNGPLRDSRCAAETLGRSSRRSEYHRCRFSGTKHRNFQGL